MSDNVIDAAERFVRAGGPDSNKRDPYENEKAIHAKALKRLREIKQEVRQGKGRPGGQLRFGIDDRMHAGIALGHIKNQLRQLGCTVADVKEVFPHIYRYLIDPDTPPEEARARAKRPVEEGGMVEMVRSYLDAAEAMARVAKLDPDKCKIEVLRDTSVWRRRPIGKEKGPGELDEAANALTLLLQKFSACAIRDSHLADLFARMRQVPGQWDICTGCFRPSRMPCIFATAFQYWLEPDDEAAPLPSVPLARLWETGWTLPVRITRASDETPPERDATSQPVSLEEGDEYIAELHLFREIRLALGPTANADSLGPLFETRAHTSLWLPDEDGATNRSGLIFPTECLSDLGPERSEPFLFDGSWHRVTALAALQQQDENDVGSWDSSLWQISPLDAERGYHASTYVSWTPVDAAHVALWLDHIEQSPRSEWVECFPEESDRKPIRETWYPWPKVGRSIEIALADGRLEAALKADVERIRTAFETHEAQWRKHMQEQTAAQIAQYGADLRTSGWLQESEMDRSDEQTS